MTRQVFQYRAEIEKRLAGKYESLAFQGETWFKINGGHYVHVDKMLWSSATEDDDALVLEHAHGFPGTRGSEDGGCFFPADMTVEEMFAAMVHEIETWKRKRKTRMPIPAIKVFDTVRIKETGVTGDVIAVCSVNGQTVYTVESDNGGGPGAYSLFECAESDLEKLPGSAKEKIAEMQRMFPLKITLTQKEIEYLRIEGIEVSPEKNYTLDEALTILSWIQNAEAAYARDAGTDKNAFALSLLYGSIADKVGKIIEWWPIPI